MQIRGSIIQMKIYITLFNIPLFSIYIIVLREVFLQQFQKNNQTPQHHGDRVRHDSSGPSQSEPSKQYAE